MCWIYEDINMYVNLRQRASSVPSQYPRVLTLSMYEYVPSWLSDCDSGFALPTTVPVQCHCLLLYHCNIHVTRLYLLHYFYYQLNYIFYTNNPFYSTVGWRIQFYHPYLSYGCRKNQIKGKSEIIPMPSLQGLYSGVD